MRNSTRAESPSMMRSDNEGRCAGDIMGREGGSFVILPVDRHSGRQKGVETIHGGEVEAGHAKFAGREALSSLNAVDVYAGIRDVGPFAPCTVEREVIDHARLEVAPVGSAHDGGSAQSIAQADACAEHVESGIGVAGIAVGVVCHLGSGKQTQTRCKTIAEIEAKVDVGCNRSAHAVEIAHIVGRIMVHGLPAHGRPKFHS